MPRRGPKAPHRPLARPSPPFPLAPPSTPLNFLCSQELQKKLREAQPRLDVEKARDGVAKVLRSAFFEQKHLRMEAGQDRTVKVSFDAEALAARFEGALVSAFEGFGSEKQIEVDARLVGLRMV